MKRKRTDVDTKKSKKILDQEILKVVKEGSDTFFEIGEETTSDVAEAVSILMRKVEWNDPVWNMEIGREIICENIVPKNSLFWLTGGYVEWNSMSHYNRQWKECCSEFDEEFGFLLIGVVKRSRTLSDIRNGFVKHLSLPILYNFAISRNMIR